jgi:outer membrane protein TolC
MRFLILLLLGGALAQAEVHTLTLPQALEIASRQNPDVALARLDEQRAQQNIKVVHDPFVPKVYAGSGLAYTYGYPNSIAGNAPSILDVRSDMAIYNKPRSYLVAAAREDARGVQFDAQNRSDEVAYRTASLFLDAQEAAKQRQAVQDRLPALRQVVEVMQTRVTEGAELPVENQRAKVNLRQAEHEFNTYKANEDYAEMMLAVTLGFSANDRVLPAESAQTFQLPPIQSEDDSVQIALSRSKQLKRLQSAVLAKEMEIRSYKASRLPQVNLVAQYALFAKYAYESYFQKFQRNNAQIGASFVIPLLIGSASAGQYQEAATDMAKLRIQINQTRNRISTDTKHSYQDMKSADETRDLARQQLDLAHQDLSNLLSLYAEGRVPLRDVERGRSLESQRWLGMYEAETQAERAKLAFLRQLGDLMTTLRASTEPVAPGLAK